MINTKSLVHVEGKQMILLVVDVQNLIVTSELYEYERFLENVRELIWLSRSHNTEVVYIRHTDEELVAGTYEHEIYADFEPKPGEKIFDKNCNSAFKDTGLIDYLTRKEEQTIIVVGLQTEYCIDATVKAGFEHGFKIIVPAFCNTTLDNEHLGGADTYHYHNDMIWNNRYAKCLSMQEVRKLFFESFLQTYNQAFYDKDVEKIRSFYPDEDHSMIYYDNHKGNDTYTIDQHMKLIADFLQNGKETESKEVEELLIEKLNLIYERKSVCLCYLARYRSFPKPAVRVSMFINYLGDLGWRIMHVHCSFEPE